jgi:hypothetical protein
MKKKADGKLSKTGRLFLRSKAVYEAVLENDNSF